MGGLSRWSWPDIEGLENFKGKVVHSAQWETGDAGTSGPEWAESIKDWGDKRVGVIGVVSIIRAAAMMIVSDKLSMKGSSAIQIVPTLQSRVKHVVNYVRGRTWISASFVKDRLEALAGEPVSNCKFKNVSLIDLPMS
jgi:cation diffusion facilitator CzcD-associated flavoprotein CzcO